MLDHFGLKMMAVFTGALLLGGCLEAEAEDRAPDYRYRLTVEVETPEGLKTGSSVIEVRQSLMRPGSDPGAGVGVSRKVRGEAVAVDLPGGQTLYALLRSENNVEWASRVYVLLAPKPEKNEPFVDQLDNVLELEGVQVLPRMWRANVLQGERSAYPQMVTFADEADPTSIVRVDPDDLAASFGQGVRLKRITAELTDDAVTTGIEERLEWVNEAWSHDYDRDGPFYAAYPTIILGLKGH